MLRALTVTLVKLKKRKKGWITHRNIREVLAKHASLIFNSGPHENEVEDQDEAASSINATHLRWACPRKENMYIRIIAANAKYNLILEGSD